MIIGVDKQQDFDLEHEKRQELLREFIIGKLSEDRKYLAADEVAIALSTIRT